MKLVIFGLTISSSWGNGHATLWRGLCRALAGRGYQIVFFEKDASYYAAHRDFSGLPGVALMLYPSWEEVRPLAEKELADADLGMVTSYCPDGIAASELLFSSPVRLRIFYDLDTPVTLQNIRAGLPVAYIGPRGLRDFDLVFSYTGGRALEEVRSRLGAQRVAPLYGSVDPAAHRPEAGVEAYRADLSYLGTYAEERQERLVRLFIEPSRRLPDRRFVLGGSQYPEHFPWTKSIFYVKHVPPPAHPAFYSSSALTLNVTRSVMAEMGYCPSGRLFEAAACGTPILSDDWEGLDSFFEPGREILIARTTAEAIDAIETPREKLARMAKAARERILSGHTAAHRADDFEKALEAASRPLINT
ncbi:MAG TPA: glycosyltransferase [Candidatus Manganitrophaceae bacterium]|nr:glycosyltransferase [Candidatus Manganitrophaceae bacterium]